MVARKVWWIAMVGIIVAQAQRTAEKENAAKEAEGRKQPHLRDPMWQRFVQFKTNYNKSYTSAAEEAKRFEAFKGNVAKVKLHNAAFARGLYTFNLTTTTMADLTYNEYALLMLGVNTTRTVRAAEPRDTFNTTAHDAIPRQWDWRMQSPHAVSRIKDEGEGKCGACWAFAATAAMECAWYQKTARQVSLSEQQLVDCVLGGQYTCELGGDPVEALNWVTKHSGIQSEADYPYVQRDQKCGFDPHEAVATFSSVKRVPAGDEVALMAAVASNVVAVSIDATSHWFQLYGWGVYSNPNCSSSEKTLNHGVAIVGYGSTQGGNDYWIVRNQWGSGWGQKGYSHMTRGINNQCGIATAAVLPVV